MNDSPLVDRIRNCRDWWLSLTQPGEKEWERLSKAAQVFASIEGCPAKIRVLPALAEHDRWKWIWALHILDEVIETLDPAPVLGECTEPEERSALTLTNESEARDAK